MGWDAGTVGWDVLAGTDAKGPPPAGRASCVRTAAQAADTELDQTNVLGLRALGALADLELHLLAAVETVEI